MTTRFTGVIVPMLTPLNSDETLDRPAVGRFVDFLVDAGVDGLFVLGSNGEGATLLPHVQDEMIDATLEAVAGRLPVIAGALETATHRIVEQVRRFEGLGVSGCVVTAPYYFNSYLGADELYTHFARIAGAAKRPLVLYNIPQMTGIALKAGLIRRLVEEHGIVGLKDSSGDWTEFQGLLRDRPSPEFTLLQGLQSMSVVSLIAGADGLIPGYANVYPRLLVDLLRETRRGDLDRAFALQVVLDRLLRIRGRALLHANKTVAATMGLMQDHVTEPLPRLTDTEATQFLEESVAAGLPLTLNHRNVA